MRFSEVEIPAELRSGLTAGLTEEEERELYDAVNLSSAPCNRTRPQALWVLGPSAAGKTRITQHALRRACGISMSEAVVVDGAMVRDYHGGWQAVKNDALTQTPPSIHKDAWDTFKAAKVSERAKSHIFSSAVANRQHLVVPDCIGCSDKAAAKVAKLRAAGYSITIAAMFAPKEICASRGSARALSEGKTFSSRGYETTMTNIQTLLTRLDDVHFTFFDNTHKEAREVTREEFLSGCRNGVIEELSGTVQGQGQGQGQQGVQRDCEGSEDEGSLGSAPYSAAPELSWMSSESHQTDERTDESDGSLLVLGPILPM